MNYLEVCYLVSKDVNISCYQFLGWFCCGWRRYYVDFRSFEFVEVCVMDYMVFLDIYSTNFWKECVFCWVRVLSYDQLSATPWTVAHQAPLSMEFSRQEYQGGLLFSHSVMSTSLWPHGPQHARLPVLHCLLEFAQTHVHWLGDAIQPSRPLSSSSPPAFSLSQNQGLFQWVGSSHQVAKVFGASASASILKDDAIKVLHSVTGVGSHFLLQGIFLIQGLNSCLLHLLRWLLYHCATWEAHSVGQSIW